MSVFDEVETDLRLAAHDAGLSVRRCSEHHLQVTGGERLVDYWPMAKRGPKCRVGDETIPGVGVEEVVALAGKPAMGKPEKPPFEVPLEAGVFAVPGLAKSMLASANRAMSASLVLIWLAGAVGSVTACWWAVWWIKAGVTGLSVAALLASLAAVTYIAGIAIRFLGWCVAGAAARRMLG